LLGDGVNFAAWLGNIAEPGGIAISSSVYDQIPVKASGGIFTMDGGTVDSPGHDEGSRRVVVAGQRDAPRLR
jgi:class 3 adenylate cyclase